ncbi:hypothetical protein HYH03_015187 [Edaphochlamys debaryana]|uniref:Protein kinase domain-containing protein n=1 Tax=Edaphochlamys debaryana TaxID=47281 RepID=A0A835XJV4_9CHLO|nr:hypothetical protein HYH03_015187 [Edaphochlamys debaryana]|eukprot:KAG2486092.1 hypothetical protein HYH03_015187 [Edaphochlamys debaryana]
MSHPLFPAPSQLSRKACRKAKARETKGGRKGHQQQAPVFNPSPAALGLVAIATVLIPALLTLCVVVAAQLAQLSPLLPLLEGVCKLYIFDCCRNALLSGVLVWGKRVSIKLTFRAKPQQSTHLPHPTTCQTAATPSDDDKPSSAHPSSANATAGPFTPSASDASAHPSSASTTSQAATIPSSEPCDPAALPDDLTFTVTCPEDATPLCVDVARVIFELMLQALPANAPLDVVPQPLCCDPSRRVAWAAVGPTSSSNPCLVPGMASRPATCKASLIQQCFSAAGDVLSTATGSACRKTVTLLLDEEDQAALASGATRDVAVCAAKALGSELRSYASHHGALAARYGGAEGADLHAVAWNVEWDPRCPDRLTLVIYTEWAQGGDLSHAVKGIAWALDKDGAVAPAPSGCLPGDGPSLDRSRLLRLVISSLEHVAALEAAGIVEGDLKFPNLVVDGPCGDRVLSIDPEGTRLLPSPLRAAAAALSASPFAATPLGAALLARARLAPVEQDVITFDVRPPEACPGVANRVLAQAAARMAAAAGASSAEAASEAETADEPSEAQAADQPSNTETADQPSETAEASAESDAPSGSAEEQEASAAPESAEPSSGSGEAPESAEPSSGSGEAPESAEPSSGSGEAPESAEPSSGSGEAPESPEPSSGSGEAPESPEPSSGSGEAPESCEAPESPVAAPEAPKREVGVQAILDALDDGQDVSELYGAYGGRSYLCLASMTYMWATCLLAELGRIQAILEARSQQGGWPGTGAANEKFLLALVGVAMYDVHGRAALAEAAAGARAGHAEGNRAVRLREG